MAKEHTLLQDGEGNIIKPFTDAEIVATKSGRSKLSTDLENIEAHIKGVLDGSVQVNHALKANRFDGERTILFEGDIEGTLKWDGSKNVSLPLKVSGNTHEHPIDKIEGLQEMLDGKADVVHEHEDYANFKSVVAIGKDKETTFVSDSEHRVLTLEAGENILFEPDADGRALRIKAIMEGALAANAESANSIKGVKLDTDTVRSANERYIPTATYGQHLIAGRGFNFHFLGSTKEYDAQLSLGLTKQLTWQLDGGEAYPVFHGGNMGHNSTLDADLLDGRHGYEYSLDGHEHEEYISKNDGGVLKQDMVLENNVAIQAKENDDFTQQSILLVNGLNEALVGSPNLPLRLRHNGDVGFVDSEGNVTEVYHSGNLPAWDDISGKPNQFTPVAHRHGVADLDDVSYENVANHLVKRNAEGNFHANKIFVNTFQAGSGTDANITKSILDAYHLRFYAKGYNYIQGENENSSLVFFTNGNTSLKVLHLTKEGNAVFGQHLDVNHDLSVGGNASLYGSLTVSLDTTLKSGLSVSGNAAISGTLGVTGKTTLNALSVSSSLTVTGASTFNGKMYLTSSLETTSNIYFHNNKGIAMKSTSGTDVWTLYIGTDDKVKLGDSAFPMEIRSNDNPKVKVGSSNYTMYHTGNKPSWQDVGALPSDHASSHFAYNSSTGRITHSGNDVKVLNSVNTDRVKLSSSGGTGNYTMWVGPESDNKTTGYIHFCTA